MTGAAPRASLESAVSPLRRRGTPQPDDQASREKPAKVPMADTGVVVLAIALAIIFMIALGWLALVSRNN